MRRKNHGDTQGEQIMKKFNQVFDTKDVSHIGDCFYQEEIEQGVKFHVRRSNFLRTKPTKGLSYGRLYDVPDEVVLRRREMARNEEIEAKRDKTFDEFMAMFEDHIEGKVDAAPRTVNRPSTPEPGDRQPGKRSDHAKSRMEDKSQHSRDDERKSAAPSGRNIASLHSDGGRSGNSSRMMTGKSESKSDLPKSCKLAYPRSLVIEKFA